MRPSGGELQALAQVGPSSQVQPFGTGRSQTQGLGSLLFGPRPLPHDASYPTPAPQPGIPWPLPRLRPPRPFPPAALPSLSVLTDPLPDPPLTFTLLHYPGPSKRPPALPAPRADRQLSLAVRSRASVRSLQPSGRQTGHGAPSLSVLPQLQSLALRWAVSPRPSAGLRESGCP